MAITASRPAPKGTAPATDRLLGDARRLPRGLHPVAWWLWAIAMATAAGRTNNPLLLLLILAVCGFVVNARRTDAPWAGRTSTHGGVQREPIGSCSASCWVAAWRAVRFCSPCRPCRCRPGPPASAWAGLWVRRAPWPPCTTGCGWPRCCAASGRPTRWPTPNGHCGCSPARCTSSASPWSSRSQWLRSWSRARAGSGAPAGCAARAASAWPCYAAWPCRWCTTPWSARWPWPPLWTRAGTAAGREPRRRLDELPPPC
jgi:hypothetical protein